MSAFPAKFPGRLLTGARLTAPLFRLLTKSPLRLAIRLLLKGRLAALLARALPPLLTKSPFLLRTGLLLDWRLTSRLTLPLLLAKTALRLRALLLLLNRWLTTRLALSLLLTKTLLWLRALLLLLNRRLAARLISSLLTQTWLRLRTLLLLLNRRLTSRSTLPLRLTKSPLQLLCVRHLASTVEKPPADGLTALCSVAGTAGFSLRRHLGKHHQCHQRSGRLKHLRTPH